VGPADFLPGYVQPHLRKETTLGFQIAATVVFSSPLLCWPDHPEAYLNSPALPFFRQVPTTWDETRVLPESRIGQLVSMARRRGSEWFVAMLNCSHHPVTLSLDPRRWSSPNMQCTVYRDTPDRSRIQIESGPAPAQPFQVDLVEGGGALFHFHPPRHWPGWM
jgi:alpha-glucosidase